MTDFFMGLPARLEEDFMEIDSDIVVDLRKNSEAFQQLDQQIAQIKKKYPIITKLLEKDGELHISPEEHKGFREYLRLILARDDMERRQLYFRGHTDAVAYLKKIKAL